jgi:hypothetical protein
MNNKKISRRDSLKALGAAGAAAVIPGRSAAQADIFSDGGRRTLDAIADVVLPSALGAAGRRDVVDAFLRWLRDYREGTDTDHGYGFTRIRQTGPSPARAYPAQMAALGAGFADQSAGDRRAAIASAIAGAKIERLPARPSGGHLATDLMAFYFNSPAAADLCYRANIGRDACRGLPGSENPPSPR